MLEMQMFQKVLTNHTTCIQNHCLLRMCELTSIPLDFSEILVHEWLLLATHQLKGTD